MRLLIAVVALLLIPSAAGASVKLTYNHLTGGCDRYGCGSGEPDLRILGDDAPRAIEISGAPGEPLIVATGDPESTFTPGYEGSTTRCEPLGEGRWKCAWPRAVIAQLGAGADRLTHATGVPVYVEGGAGDDALTGGSGADTLDGGPGRDTLSGGTGEDELRVDGLEADAVDGGAGDDRMVIGGAAGVRVDVASGTFGDGGTLTSVMGIQGGAGDDVIRGDGGVNQLSGGEGNDVITGFGGADDLRGGPGGDTIDGGDGNDAIDPGSTPVEQTEGLDETPTGAIAYWEPDGAADRIACGAGIDHVIRPDAPDVVRRPCERTIVFIGSSEIRLSRLFAPVRRGRLSVLARCLKGSVTLRLRGLATGRRGCDRHLRLRVPRRLPRTIDVTVSSSESRREPGRFRLRR